MPGWIVAHWPVLACSQQGAWRLLSACQRFHSEWSSLL